MKSLAELELQNKKEVFIQSMKKRTKAFAVRTIRFCNSLKKGKASSVITYQLIKSSTSVGANYIAACGSRSKKEFFSKMCIVSEEADESIYWLEIIQELRLSDEVQTLNQLLQEIKEVTKIVNSAKHSAYPKVQRFNGSLNPHNHITSNLLCEN